MHNLTTEQHRALPHRMLVIAATVAIASSVVAATALTSRAQEYEDGMSPEKAAAIAADKAYYEEGLTNQAPVPADPASERPADVPEPFPVGIFGKDQAEFPAGLGFEFENIWKRVLDGHQVVVYAGGRVDQREQGILLIQRTDPSSGERTFEVLATPGRGPVHIESAAGDVATLARESGARIEFNLRNGVCAPDPCGVWRVKL